MLNRNFEKATIEDIKNLIIEIEKQNYSDWTKQGYRITIKKFWKWLDGDDKKVSWIKTGSKIRTELPKVLSEEDISKMIESCNHPRDKALISCFYEGGLRASELLTMKIGDVNFDNRGCFIIVRGKTGPRRVRLITSHYLSDWIACLPLKIPETPIWTSLATNCRGKPFTYTSLRNLLRKIAQRAGIRKRVNPHIFRHSRASQLANKLTESQLNEHFGWVQGSDMTRVYVHLSGRNLDNALLESQENTKPIACPKCGQQIPKGYKFCFSCGLPLDTQTTFNKAIGMDRLEELLSKIDIEKLEKLLDKV